METLTRTIVKNGRIKDYINIPYNLESLVRRTRYQAKKNRSTTFLRTFFVTLLPFSVIGLAGQAFFGRRRETLEPQTIQDAALTLTKCVYPYPRAPAQSKDCSKSMELDAFPDIVD